MPGLAGIIANNRSVGIASMLSTMLESMRHESFYVFGKVVEPDNLLGVGWVALKNSFSDCMPLWNETKDICLILSGEIYCDDSELMPLRGRHRIAAQNDASYLVHLYEEQGPDMLAGLNGWFAGIIIDQRARKQILFTDRFGLGRIYYHESRNGFLFSSEAKSLLAAIPSLRQMDQRGLAEYYSVGCVLQNRTLFSDISIVPGGSAWTFHRDGRIEKGRFFSPASWENQEPLDAVTYSKRLTDVFAQIAPRYFRGPEQSALSLTGGLDSRMVLAWSRHPPGTLPCYTFGGPYRDCADVTIARQLAGICGHAHTTIEIGAEFLKTFEALAEKSIYLSDGNMDVTGAVELYANQLAREIAPVRLTGNYGSEILRSNIAFRPRVPDGSLLTPEFIRLIQEAAETYRSEAVGHRLSFIAFKQVPWHHYARQSIEKSQLTPRSPFLDNDLVALAYQAPPELRESAGPLLQLIETGDPKLSALSSDRAFRYRSHRFLAPLANKWQEFTAKAEYAYDYGMPKWLVQIDQALSPLHLEKLFLGRHKFYHFRVWYRDSLKSYLQRCSEDTSNDFGCYRPGAEARAINDHISGRSNHTLELHRILTLRLLNRSLLAR